MRGNNSILAVTVDFAIEPMIYLAFEFTLGAHPVLIRALPEKSRILVLFQIISWMPTAGFE